MRPGTDPTPCVLKVPIKNYFFFGSAPVISPLSSTLIVSSPPSPTNDGACRRAADTCMYTDEEKKRTVKQIFT